jgi:hypothetical protein
LAGESDWAELMEFLCNAGASCFLARAASHMKMWWQFWQTYKRPSKLSGPISRSIVHFGHLTFIVSSYSSMDTISLPDCPHQLLFYKKYLNCAATKL